MSATPPAAPVPAAEQDEHDALPAGTRLDEFEILRVLGVGGFGIVYLAMDHALERQVAIKEYMPGSLAVRGQSSMVSLRSASHGETFGIGLRSFVNEAKLLARFDHPSLVKVYRFWEANGTAYMVMPFYLGRTLKEERRAVGQTPADAWVRSMVEPLLGALEALHKADVFHRDIAPDNILLPPDAQPVLLDFGAARRVIGDRSQNLTAILKPNFAPIEQYAEVSHLRQGPWTDLYALGAVLHFVATGKPPVPASTRAVHDELLQLGAADSPYAQALTLTLRKTIDWALAVRPADRPQNVQQFRDALAGLIVPPERPVADISMEPTIPAERVVNAWAPTAPHESSSADINPKPALDGESSAYAPTMIVANLSAPPAAAKPPSAAPAPARTRSRRSAAVPAPAPRQRMGWLAMGVGMVVVAVASWMLGARHEAREDAALPTIRMQPNEPLPMTATSQAAAQTIDAEVPSPVRAAPVTAAAEPKARPAASKAQRAASRPTSGPANVVAKAPTAPVPAVTENTSSATPRQACGSRVFVAMVRCMKRECETARYRDHPQCQKLRREEEAVRTQGG